MSESTEGETAQRAGSGSKRGMNAKQGGAKEKMGGKVGLISRETLNATSPGWTCSSSVSQILPQGHVGRPRVGRHTAPPAALLPVHQAAVPSSAGHIGALVTLCKEFCCKRRVTPLQYLTGQHVGGAGISGLGRGRLGGFL